MKLSRWNKVLATQAHQVKFFSPAFHVARTLHAVTAFVKFSTAPDALHCESLKRLAICLCQTQDWGIVCWHAEPLVSLPEVPHVPMKFNNLLPVIPPPAHLHQLIAHAQSSTEADLIAADAAAKVTKHLRFVLHELGCTQTEPAPICEDDDSAIKIVNLS